MFIPCAFISMNGGSFMKLTEYQDLNYISYERLPMRTGVVP